MCAKFFEGDIAGCRKLQYDAIPLINAPFCEVNQILVKTALKYIGFAAGPMRMPLTDMEEENAARLKKEMENFGLI
jgi:4-hydroxy-tetrahydrodipicolinate synthase